jgi:hypothetical protein
MKVEKLACPSCGAPLAGDFSPNQQIECNSCGVPLFLAHPDADNPIFCPKCRTLNSDDVYHCVNCGEPLKVECILCHTQNRIDTAYCSRCGVHLERSRTKRRLLQETSSLLRKERIEAFKEKAAHQKEEKLHRLLEALDEPENHDFAIYQINQMGLEAVEPLTETLLTDDDPDARYGSARALGQICAEQKIKALIKARTAKALITALADPEPAVRYWSADALGKCKSHLAITPLSALLKDPHEGVRLQARSSLASIGGERVQEILAKEKSKGFKHWLKGS